MRVLGAESLCCTRIEVVTVMSERLINLNIMALGGGIYIYIYIYNGPYIWLAKRSIQGFPKHLMDDLKELFGQPNAL